MTPQEAFATLKEFAHTALRAGLFGDFDSAAKISQALNVIEAEYLKKEYAKDLATEFK